MTKCEHILSCILCQEKLEWYLRKSKLAIEEVWWRTSQDLVYKNVDTATKYKLSNILLLLNIIIILLCLPQRSSCMFPSRFPLIIAPPSVALGFPLLFYVLPPHRHYSHNHNHHSCYIVYLTGGWAHSLQAPECRPATQQVWPYTVLNAFVIILTHSQLGPRFAMYP